MEDQQNPNRILRNLRQKGDAQASYQQAMAELATASQRVEWLLSRSTACRNSDEILIKWYRKFFGENCSTETIRRTRQHIQNTKGEYPPTKPEIIKIRESRRKAHKEYYIHQNLTSKQQGRGSDSTSQIMDYSLGFPNPRPCIFIK